MVIVTHESYDSVLVGTGKQKGLESLSENAEWHPIYNCVCTDTCVCRPVNFFRNVKGQSHACLPWLIFASSSRSNINTKGTQPCNTILLYFWTLILLLILLYYCYYYYITIIAVCYQWWQIKIINNIHCWVLWPHFVQCLLVFLPHCTSCPRHWPSHLSDPNAIDVNVNV